MEIPILATMTGMAFFFWEFLRTGDRRAFVASAAVGGPGVLVQVHGRRPAADLRDSCGCSSGGGTATARRSALALTVAAAMAGYAAIMGDRGRDRDGRRMLPISARTGDHPSFQGKLGPILSGVSAG